MIEERFTSTVSAALLAVGAVALGVGAWGPWFVADAGGQLRSLDADLALQPYRIVQSVGAGLVLALAVGLWFARRSRAHLVVRAVSPLAALTSLVMTLGGWMMVWDGRSLRPLGADAQGAVARPDWGLMVLAAGGLATLVGLLWPSRRRAVEVGPRVTRPGDAAPVARAGLAPGWYDVERRRVWWDGRAWDDIPDTEDAAPQASV